MARNSAHLVIFIHDYTSSEISTFNNHEEYREIIVDRFIIQIEEFFAAIIFAGNLSNKLMELIAMRMKAMKTTMNELIKKLQFIYFTRLYR